MHDAYTCPHCGGRVTPFAAGCAYCGADLDAERRRRATPPMRRLRDGLVELRHRARRPGTRHRLSAHR
ncbi:hypothetical protein GKE82_20555 [Conexibacter sp. W3-3-2]|uniref:Zinc ribbon domain-containing protein n=1 Tax=Paraconexibacter algicola TaxID=2133960 RepID=A0A2T4UM77_9ACTN|nr:MULTISPECIES: hypothetical protein [Solirubrobacterales]MTD46614.1 hypothetical protein [Conexibacter sp. W3-3-2]PTL60335.1 hypothetical protein C7Y72_12155 [Paraconexibacter algicola]